MRSFNPSMALFGDDGTSLYHDCLLYGIQFYSTDPNNANNYQVSGKNGLSNAGIYHRTVDVHVGVSCVSAVRENIKVVMK